MLCKHEKKKADQQKRIRNKQIREAGERNKEENEEEACKIAMDTLNSGAV